MFRSCESAALPGPFNCIPLSFSCITTLNIYTSVLAGFHLHGQSGSNEFRFVEGSHFSEPKCHESMLQNTSDTECGAFVALDLKQRHLALFSIRPGARKMN